MFTTRISVYVQSQRLREFDMTISRKDFEGANRRGVELKAQFSELISVRYDGDIEQLTFELRSGVKLLIPLHMVTLIENAKTEDFVNFEVSPSGLGVYFPSLDLDIYLPALFTADGLAKK